MTFRSVFDAGFIRTEFDNARINTQFIPSIWKYVIQNPNCEWRQIPSLPSAAYLLLSSKFKPCTSVVVSTENDEVASEVVAKSKRMEMAVLGLLFGLWYLFNIYLNIYNKQISFRGLILGKYGKYHDLLLANSEMWDWQGEEYGLQTNTSNSLWNNTNENQDDLILSYVFNETTPAKSFEDLAYQATNDENINKETETCRETYENAAADDDDDWEGVESTELDEAFSAATAFVATAAADRSSVKVSSDLQLKLYGLNKIATEGPCSVAQPSAIKMTARAKW